MLVQSNKIQLRVYFEFIVAELMVSSEFLLQFSNTMDSNRRFCDYSLGVSLTLACNKMF